MGQIFGILFIVVNSMIARQIPTGSYTYDSVQTCNNKLNLTASHSVVTSDYSFYSDSNSGQSLEVLDFATPVYAQTGILVVVAVLFTVFFECSYLRLSKERENLAEEILSSAQVNYY